MNLHTKLRQGTKELHQQIECSRHLKKIIEKNITLDEYKRLLELFYGYISPCENAIQKNSNLKNMLANREKSNLIAQDLQAINTPQYRTKKIIQCSKLPDLNESDHLLGYLYVMEGATLGGQIITKILYNVLNLTPDKGTKYFFGYGNKTKENWSHFCQNLNSITSSKQQNNIIDSACLTYTTLNNWLEGSQKH